MRGDYIVVTATTSNQWYNQIKVCKTNNYWAGDALTTISNYDFSSNDSKLIIPVSEDIISSLNSETAPQYTLYFDGYNYTMTSVDVVYNQGKANLYYNELGKSLNYYGGQLLAPSLFAVASVGDIVTIDVTSATEWGNVSIYNKCPKSVWDGTDMVDPEGLTKLTTLNVDPANAPTTVSLVLTEELLANAKENGLSLGDGNYTFTSVDLLYTPTVTIGSAGYATLGYAAALDLTDIDAYTVSVSGSTATLTSVKDKKIPAGTGIILEGSGNVTIPLTTEATDEITGNELLVSDGTVAADCSTIYVLANGNDGIGFYLLKSGHVHAGKAYLQLPASAGVRQFIGFGDDSETTGIDNLTPTLSKGEGVYYDLQGRRVAQPTKGLYVVRSAEGRLQGKNGKKVVKN